MERIVFLPEVDDKNKQDCKFYDVDNILYSLDFDTYFESREGRINVKQEKNDQIKLLKKGNYLLVEHDGNSINNIKLLERLLPVDTMSFVNETGNGPNLNFGLLINKAPKFCSGGGFRHVNHDKKWLTQFDFSGYADLLLYLNNRQSLALHRLFPENDLMCQKLKTSWRMAIGMGGESVYENDLKLHPVFGFPYIPGEAVKGVVRSWIIREVFKKNEGKALKSKLFCDLFGCDKNSFYKEPHQGKFDFMDAYPHQIIEVAPDVMTVHYKDYYNDPHGKTPPADYLEPVVISFLTVVNTCFIFYVALNSLGVNGSMRSTIQEYRTTLKDSKGMTIKDDLLSFSVKELGLNNKSKMLELISCWLTQAIEWNGIGAKTAVGYGRLKKADNN